MQERCHFYLEVQAPQGLTGIEEHLGICKLNLVPRVSNFNGQVLLHSQLGEDRFEFNMNPSGTDILVASGQVYLPEREAWELLLSLADALKRAGFPHRLGMDSPCGQRSCWTSYAWPRQECDLTYLPPGLASKSLSTREIVLPLADTVEAVRLLAEQSIAVVGWEAWGLYPGDRVGPAGLHRSDYPGRRSTETWPEFVQRAAANCLETARHAKVWLRNELPNVAIHFCLSLATECD